MDEKKNWLTIIVAGENSEEMMEKYDINKKVTPYVVYKYEDAGTIKKRFINIGKGLLESDKGYFSREERESMINAIETAENETDEDFYLDYTSENYTYDPETGDAVTDRNPDGKWTKYQNGKNYSIQFISKNGITTSISEKGDVEWDKMHHSGIETYEKAWDMIMGDMVPSNDIEKKIYENMKSRRDYFEKFGTRENYINSCTAFWCYAFLSEETGWVELKDNEDQFVWMKNYYEKFILPLPDNTLLTIYEYLS